MEALAPGKLSSVSNLKSVKDLDLSKFVAVTPILIKELTAAATRGFNREPIHLGDTVYRITKYSLENKSIGTNVALGYAILSTTITYSLGVALSMNLDLRKINEALLSTHGKLMKELENEKACKLYKAINVSETHLGTYKGRVPDVRDLRKCADFSLSEILRASAYDDEIADEVIGGFKRTIEAYIALAKLSHTSNNNALAMIPEVQKMLLSRYIDTLVLKTWGYPTAEVLRTIAHNLSRSGINIEEIDTYLRVKGVNPGTTSDIISCAVGLLEVSSHASNHN
jgi:triphosphoribosyl-dephospho-CoA synthetase